MNFEVTFTQNSARPMRWRSTNYYPPYDSWQRINIQSQGNFQENSIMIALNNYVIIWCISVQQYRSTHENKHRQGIGTGKGHKDRDRDKERHRDRHSERNLKITVLRWKQVTHIFGCTPCFTNTWWNINGLWTIRWLVVT